MMNIQDLETAVRLKLNIVVMVWEDHEYGLIKWKQQTQFGEHTELALHEPGLGRSWPRRSAGRASSARTPAILQVRLDKAFAYQGPTILALPIDYTENMKLTVYALGQIAAVI